jgi:hypothetical protein
MLESQMAFNLEHVNCGDTVAESIQQERKVNGPATH